MNTVKLTLAMMVLFVGSMYGQGFGVNCPTLEQQQAAYNQGLANKVVVVNTSSQQLQCYYQQLATYWQQRDKDNQQKAKDAQQIAKDIQQAAKDKQQIETDSVLAEKLAALNNCDTNYDEVVCFIENIVPYIGNCSSEFKNEITRIHKKRCGEVDVTPPPPTGCNIHGFDNAGHLFKR